MGEVAIADHHLGDKYANSGESNTAMQRVLSSSYMNLSEFCQTIQLYPKVYFKEQTTNAGRHQTRY